ncbi:hypothetical protein [Mucilaginibacter sp.]
MRSIYVKLLLACLLSFASLFVAAQDNKPAISIGPDLLLPLNTSNNYARDIYKDGVGADIKFEQPIYKNLKVTLSAGFVSFGDKQVLATPGVMFYNVNQSNTVESNNTYKQLPFRFIPVTAGLQYYLVKYVYVAGTLGDAIRFGDNNGNIVTDENGKVISNGNNEYSSFIWSAGAGITAPFDKHNLIDFGVKYERGFKTPTDDYSMSAIGIRLAYKYNF